MGQIIIEGKQYDVIDVIKAPGRQHLHLINATKTIKIGDGAHLIIDQLNRLNSSRNHSVEHLIQHALQTVIDKNIKQEGAFKSAEKVSFDYHYHVKLSDQQIAQVQAKVNEYIKDGFKVQTKIMSLDEAKKAGAIAYFEDTYSKLGKDLRVVCMGDVSMEICGGTHVNKISDIEQFLILKIDNKGSGS
ncbi:hypothetical protein FACS1894166_04780 [Bacilli bacterium]|nr:hypothetical protein FACS1894166_04780 [Bacilli bacterium]